MSKTVRHGPTCIPYVCLVIHARLNPPRRVRYFNYKNMAPLCVLIRHTASARCIATSHHPVSGYLTAVGSNDTHISVWDLYSNAA
jgi:WD40 repeat protein